MKPILGLFFLIALSGCVPKPIVNPATTSTMAANGVAQTPTTTIPESWTRVFDGALQIEVAYPSIWFIRPSSNTQEGLKIYSFSPGITVADDPIPETEIKITISYSSPGTSSSQMFGPENQTANSDKVVVDGHNGVTWNVSGPESAKVVQVSTQPETIYTISASPLDSLQMDQFDLLLSYIQLDEPAPIAIQDLETGAKVTSPLKLQGYIKTDWLTEGQTLVDVRQDDTRLLGQTVAVTQETSMADTSVLFTADLDFEPPSTSQGYIYVHKSNSSGLSHIGLIYTWPIRFD